MLAILVEFSSGHWYQVPVTEYALRDHGHMVTSSKTSVTEIAITEEISILTSICHGKDSGCCGRKVEWRLRIACL